MNENYRPDKIESIDIPESIKEDNFSDQELAKEFRSAVKKIEDSVQRGNDRQSGEKREIEASSGLSPEITEEIAEGMDLKEKFRGISGKREELGKKITALIMTAMSVLPAGMMTREAYAQDLPPAKNERISDMKKPSIIEDIDKELDRISKKTSESDTAEREKRVLQVLDELKRSKNPNRGMSSEEILKMLNNEIKSTDFMEKIYDLANPDREIMRSNMDALARGLSSVFGIGGSEAEAIVKKAFKGSEANSLFVHDKRQRSDSMIEEAERLDNNKKSFSVDVFKKKF